jgi:acetylornithine/N-succinyldiaminopimelate aminotransferase
MNLRQRDTKYFGREGEPEDVIAGGSADSYLTDARGRKYVDFMMGWCVGNLGWWSTEIRAAELLASAPSIEKVEVLAAKHPS